MSVSEYITVLSILPTLLAAAGALWAAREMNRLWIKKNTPDIYASFMRDSNKIYFILENYSEAAATNVSINFKHNFEFLDGKLSSNLPYFKNIPFIPPGHTHCTALTTQFLIEHAKEADLISDTILNSEVEISFDGPRGSHRFNRKVHHSTIVASWFGKKDENGKTVHEKIIFPNGAFRD